MGYAIGILILFVIGLIGWQYTLAQKRTAAADLATAAAVTEAVIPVDARTATCMALANKYNIVPGLTWGSADADAIASYNTNDCNQPIVANCEYAKKVYGYNPNFAWGSGPSAYHDVLWGSMPAAYHGWVTC